MTSTTQYARVRLGERGRSPVTPAGSPTAGAADRAATGYRFDPFQKGLSMLLINEQLARSRMREVREDASTSRRLNRLRTARRWQRRADRASRRAAKAWSELA